MRRKLWLLLLLLSVPSQVSAECQYPNCPFMLMGISNGIYYYACYCCPGTILGMGVTPYEQSGVPCCHDGVCSCTIIPAFAPPSNNKRALSVDSGPLKIVHPHGRIQWIPDTQQPTLPKAVEAAFIPKNRTVTVSNVEVVEVSKGVAAPLYFKVFTILHAGKFNYQIGVQVQKPDFGQPRAAVLKESRTYGHKIEISAIGKPFLVSTFDAL